MTNNLGYKEEVWMEKTMLTSNNGTTSMAGVQGLLKKQTTTSRVSKQGSIKGGNFNKGDE